MSAALAAMAALAALVLAACGERQRGVDDDSTSLPPRRTTPTTTSTSTGEAHGAGGQAAPGQFRAQQPDLER